MNEHDFPDPKVPKAVHYGVYDIGDNSGWVNVGISSDTAEFSVGSIEYWWGKIGIKKYLKAKKILICADSGGSNSSRSHLWKRELQKFSNAKNIEISVCQSKSHKKRMRSFKYYEREFSRRMELYY